MVNIQRIPDRIKIHTEDGECLDSIVSFEEKAHCLSVYLTAKQDKPRYISMRWKAEQTGWVSVLGDHWERLQSDTHFGPLNADRYLPWYFVVTDGTQTDGCGVMVQPNSFVSFSVDSEGVTGWFDVRCGGKGVELDGRKLHVADIVSRHYENMTSYDALCYFCGVMCPNPLLPKEPVYGGNNWYYAYGNSSAEEIINDTTLLAELTEDNDIRPFMVIDDCWQPEKCCGPWIPNEKFPDVKGLVNKLNDMGVQAGIWVRFLHNKKVYDEHPEYRIVKPDTETFLDPSRNEVLDIIKEDIKRIKEWGFRLIKHDFSSYDMFGRYGASMNGAVAERNDWAFFDKKRTSAEIVLDFYRTIREACGDDMMIVGCNTFSHLCAGLVEINRTGDDTSGSNWDRSRTFGVNTLAFRMPQNNKFYACDADCAGFVEDMIPWELNKQWVDLLSKSGTPLFISCPQGLLNREQKEFLKEAFKNASIKRQNAIPLDWEYNINPSRWQIDGEEVRYDWYRDEFPRFLECSKYHTHR